MRPFGELASDGDPRVGLEIYIQGIRENNESSSGIWLRTYANYLLNGGTRDGWLDLTEEEVKLMAITMKLENEQRTHAIASMIGRMFGGEKR